MAALPSWHARMAASRPMFARLTGFGLSRGTIRFSAATPLPDEVVRFRCVLR